MVLTRCFGSKAQRATEQAISENKVIDFARKKSLVVNLDFNTIIEKQLAKCMKEIQQLMAKKNDKLQRLDTIKIIS